MNMKEKTTVVWIITIVFIISLFIVLTVFYIDQAKKASIVITTTSDAALLDSLHVNYDITQYVYHDFTDGTIKVMTRGEYKYKIYYLESFTISNDLVHDGEKKCEQYNEAVEVLKKIIAIDQQTCQ